MPNPRLAELLAERDAEYRRQLGLDARVPLPRVLGNVSHASVGARFMPDGSRVTRGGVPTT